MARETAPDPGLLGDDHLGGGFGDGEASPETVRFVIVEHEHRQAVVVTGQTLETQVADLLGTTPRVDSELDAGAHLRRADLGKIRAELGHDLGRLGASGFGRL